MLSCTAGLITRGLSIIHLEPKAYCSTSTGMLKCFCNPNEQ